MTDTGFSENFQNANLYRSDSFDNAMRNQIPTTRFPVDDHFLDDHNRFQEKDDEEYYSVKWIDFHHERLPILLQNRNGPCPLLAIANILLLRKRIQLHSDLITTKDLMALIADQILRFDVQQQASVEQRLNHEHNVQDAINVLPKLRTGMDINLKFHRVDQFEYTPECIIFDITGIRLFHGWIVDPEDQELYQIIRSNGSGYNQLAEIMARGQFSDDVHLRHQSEIIRQFFESNPSQLTHIGLMELRRTVPERELAVLFRNNHFSVLWKNEGKLYLLVSDQGYSNHPSIVFETLENVHNDSMFTDGYGRTWQNPNLVDSRADFDYAVALELQEREKYQQNHFPQQSKRDELAEPRRRRRKSHSDSSNCCILY